MNYNLADKTELKAARNRMSYLARKGRRVSLVEKSPNRTLSQNNYLYLIIEYYGSQVGYTKAEAKTVFKRDVNPDLFIYDVKGSKFLKSTADLSVEDMSKAIDRFIRWAGEAGVEIPPATNPEWLAQIENEIERSRRYL